MVACVWIREFSFSQDGRSEGVKNFGECGYRAAASGTAAVDSDGSAVTTRVRGGDKGKCIPFSTVRCKSK